MCLVFAEQLIRQVDYWNGGIAFSHFYILRKSMFSKKRIKNEVYRWRHYDIISCQVGVHCLSISKITLSLFLIISNMNYCELLLIFSEEKRLSGKNLCPYLNSNTNGDNKAYVTPCPGVV